MFDGFKYTNFCESDTGRKLYLPDDLVEIEICSAEEFGITDGDRFSRFDGVSKVMLEGPGDGLCCGMSLRDIL